MVSYWEPAHYLVKDVASGAETAVAPCLLSLAVTYLSASGDGGPYTVAGLLSFSIRATTCSVCARGPCVALEPFMEKFSFFFFFNLSVNPMVWVAISH